MRSNLPKPALLVLAVIFLRLGSAAYGQSATAINGLYYTGVDNNGGLLPTVNNVGTTDSHWTVTYAKIGTSSTGNTTYQGAAYVVNPSPTFIDPNWVQNTTSSQWITAPGARTSSGGNSSTANKGGDYLPGNGTTGANSASYVYTLAFTVAGSGAVGTTVTNQVSITLSIAADDAFQVYLNPTLDAFGGINTGSSTLGGSGAAAGRSTEPIVLKNFGASPNAAFKIGTNYLTIVVQNTNGAVGNSGSNTRGPSGLLVYQVYGDMTIDGRVVPEVGTWLPVVLAFGLYIRRRFFGNSGAIA